MFHGLHFSSYSPLELHAYLDANWAGDPTNRHSTIGYCFFLGNSLILWRSKKQFVVVGSSTEVEYRALADTTQELLWFRWLLKDIGITVIPVISACIINTIFPIMTWLDLDSLGQNNQPSDWTLLPIDCPFLLTNRLLLFNQAIA